MKAKHPYLTSVFLLSFILISAPFHTACSSTRLAFEGEDADLMAEKSFPTDCYLPQDYTWSPVTEDGSICYFKFQNKKMPVVFHCVKVDLSSPNLQLVSYPAPEDAESEWYEKLSVKGFSARSGATVAVNFTPFANRTFYTFTFAGIHKTEGKAFSLPVKKYAALCLSKTVTNGNSGYTAAVLEKQEAEELCKWENAFGGFFQIIKDGKELPFVRHSYDSRTAIGVSKDGKTLYLLVAEGEMQAQSIGLSYQQCSRILLALGAWNALEADGGSSTDLCINGKSVLGYTSPIPVGNCIGFKSTLE